MAWNLNGGFWGRVKAVDRHLERGSMETIERYKNMKYLSSNLLLKYHWNEALSLKAGVEIVKHFKTENRRWYLLPMKEKYQRKRILQELKSKYFVFIRF